MHDWTGNVIKLRIECKVIICYNTVVTVSYYVRNVIVINAKPRSIIFCNHKAPQVKHKVVLVSLLEDSDFSNGFNKTIPNPNTYKATGILSTTEIHMSLVYKRD